MCVTEEESTIATPAKLQSIAKAKPMALSLTVALKGAHNNQFVQQKPIC